MGSSLSSSKKAARVLLSGIIAVQLVGPNLFAEPVRPFPVLGEVTLEDGHWNQVPLLLEKLPEMVKDEPVRFELEASAGEQFFSQSLYDESRKAFQRLLKAKKPSPSLFLQQGANLRLVEISLIEGHADDAMRDLDPLLHDSNPYVADEALFLKARVYLYKHQWDDLNRTLKDLVRQNPAFAEDLSLNLMRAVASLEQDRPDEALVYLKKYPDSTAAMYYTAVAYIHKKEISNALPLYQQILQKDPHSDWVDRTRLMLGEAFYMGHDFTLAEQFFKPITRPQADPQLRALALHRRACIYFQQKDFVDCDKTLLDLLKQYPSHPLRSQWSYLHASVPIFQKDWKKAIQEQKMSLEAERGLAPKLYGADKYQLRLSAEFRILWAHMLLNDFTGTRILADRFIQSYPNELMTSYAYLAKGMAFYRMGDYDRALEAYQNLLNKFPTSSACGKAVYLMTLCLHSSRDPFRMAGILNEVHTRMSAALDTKSVDDWTQNTLYWVADAYFQLNDLVSAEKIYKEFVLRAPQSPLVPYALEALGATMSAQGPTRDGEAAIALTQAELRARDLGNREFAEQVDLELGKIYYNQHDFAKASSTWAQLVQVSTNTNVRAEALYREGDALAHQEYYQEAIKRWQLLAHNFKSSPLVADSLMRIGNTQAGLGQWTEAAQTFTTLKQTFAGTDAGKEGAFQLVQCAFNQGNLGQAVNELLSFAKQYPDDARIPKTADNLLGAFHQHKTAVPAAQQAALLKLAPGSVGGAALLWEKGASLFNDGKYEPAQKLFEKIMLSYPNDEYAPLAYFYNADCFFWLQRWDDAANAYQNFFLSFPKHERVPNAMFQKAVCLFRKGSYDDAVADFQAFLNKYPNHALAKEAWLNIALAHKKAFQLDQAVTAYKYVIDHYADDPKINAVWLQMGSLLEVQGKYSEAAATYAKVPENVPEHAEALYRRALLCEQTHNVAQEKMLLEKLRVTADKKNEFRLAGLIKLSEIYEQEGAPVGKLKPVYEDLVATSTDPEVAKQAGLRLKELK